MYNHFIMGDTITDRSTENRIIYPASSYEENERIIPNYPDRKVKPFSEAEKLLPKGDALDKDGEVVDLGITSIETIHYDPKTKKLSITGINPVVPGRDESRVTLSCTPDQAKRLLKELGEQAKRIPVISRRIDYELEMGEHGQKDEGGNFTPLTVADREAKLAQVETAADSVSEQSISGTRDMYAQSALWRRSDFAYDYTTPGGEIRRVNNDRRIEVEIPEPITVDPDSVQIVTTESIVLGLNQPNVTPGQPGLELRIQQLRKVPVLTGGNRIFQYVTGSFQITPAVRSRFEDVLLEAAAYKSIE